MNYDKLITSAVRELSETGNRTAQIDVRALLRHVVKEDDVFLLTHNSELITNAQYQKFRRLIRRRKKGEPIAYLVGHKEFFGLDFFVNKDVLIPRPETEILVEESLGHLTSQSMNREGTNNLDILDIGTGSGCIIVSIAKNIPPDTGLLRLFASDISAKALTVAKKNARHQGLYDNIRFLNSDLFSNPRLPSKLDLIVANLPYLNRHKTGIKHTIRPEKIGLEFEPPQALYVRNNGFELIERLLHLLPHKLKKTGIALLETDESQADKIKAASTKLHLNAEIIENVNAYKGFWRISLQ